MNERLSSKDLNLQLYAIKSEKISLPADEREVVGHNFQEERVKSDLPLNRDW